jgi:hypothetical protein
LPCGQKGFKYTQKVAQLESQEHRPSPTHDTHPSTCSMATHAHTTLIHTHWHATDPPYHAHLICMHRARHMHVHRHHAQHQHATYISNTCVQTQHCTYMRVTYTCAHTILTYTHIHVYTTTTCPPIHPYTQLHTCTHTLPGWAHHPTLDPEQKWGLQV